MILVTGGAGFIGSNFVLDWMRQTGEAIVNLDKLTYAGNLHNLKDIWSDSRHVFAKGDICDAGLVSQLMSLHQPRAIINFAAESHVDRSIISPENFVKTNINGTFNLLETARVYWSSLPNARKEEFRFLHVSTDEVYGSLGPDEAPFCETDAYAPNSPYAASKAASDHLVRAYFHTYGLPTLTTNCSNNYGPFHFPEKLIPLMIANALENKPLPIYGDGQNIRDWLYVEDHCCAIRRVLNDGKPGQTYNIGGRNEKTNSEVVHTLCDMLDLLSPKSNGASYRAQIIYVQDRPGHDRRYAIDGGKIERELGWTPSETFESGMKKTVQWYLDNREWIDGVRSDDCRKSIQQRYGFLDEENA